MSSSEPRLVNRKVAVAMIKSFPILSSVDVSIQTSGTPQCTDYCSVVRTRCIITSTLFPFYTLILHCDVSASLTYASINLVGEDNELFLQMARDWMMEHGGVHLRSSY